MVENIVKVVEPTEIDIEVKDITKEFNTKLQKNKEEDIADEFLSFSTDSNEVLSEAYDDGFDNNWNLVVDHVYHLKLTLYDITKHKINIPDDFLFTVVLSSNFLDY
jgi:hypothetical protein